MKYYRFTVISFVVLFLTGCWDQRELKNIRMVHTAGIDLLNNNDVRLTVSMPTIKASLESQGNVVTPIASADAHTVQEANIKLQKIVSQHMDLRESRVLLVNKSFAERGLYEALDFFYREAHYPINVYIAVTDTFAQDIISLNVEDRSLISDYLYDLLVSNEQEGFIPKVSPYLISSIMRKSGIDNVLPLIKLYTEKKRAGIIGVALFHNKKMTGQLDDAHTRTFVMLTYKKIYGSLTEKIGPNNTYVTFTFTTYQPKMDISVQDGIAVTLDVKIQCHLLDNPSGLKLEASTLDRMSHQLELLLTKRAEETIQQLQKANCDGFGIGARMKAYHNRMWKSLDWDEVYPTISIKPSIKVTIESHGLLD